MIKAIWPSFARMKNHLPASANITSAGQWSWQSLPTHCRLTLQFKTGLLSYFIFWLIQFPFLLVSPQKIRWLFLVKSLVVPPTFLAMMIWAFAKTGGGPLFSQTSTLSGSKQSWTWLSAMNSALGNYAVSVYRRSLINETLILAYTLTDFGREHPGLHSLCSSSLRVSPRSRSNLTLNFNFCANKPICSTRHHPHLFHVWSLHRYRRHVSRQSALRGIHMGSPTAH
jgi:hypothetical protein